MKVGVIGAGGVGSACVLALAMRAVAREIIVIDRTRAARQGGGDRHALWHAARAARDDPRRRLRAISPAPGSS